ncbi:MAG: hypothetical protein ACHQ51_05735 [Elusimicrobiota bacterium]
MNPLAFLALIPLSMLAAMYLYERTHQEVAMRVRSDGRRAPR